MTAIGWMMRLEEQVIATFRTAGATAPESAIAPPRWASGTQRKMFDRFVRKRAIVSVDAGRYYLDERRWAEYSSARWRGFAIYMAIVVILTIALIIWMP